MRYVQKSVWGEIVYATATGYPCPASEGDLAHVIWPDDTRSQEVVAARRDRIVVSGTPIERVFLGFEVIYRGVPVFVPLDAVDIVSFGIKKRSPKKTMTDAARDAELRDRRREGELVGIQCTCAANNCCPIHAGG
jgi:hypothetical protein